MYITKVDFKEEAKKLSCEAFVSKYNFPFMLQFEEFSEAETGEKTNILMTVSIKNIQDLIKNALSQRKIIDIFPVTKSDRNPFSGMITIGRTHNQDICIENPGVSKFHAYFQMKDKIYTLIDKGSTNGTFVNGVRINMPREITNGNKITIAGITCTFYTPENAYEIMKTAS